MLETGNSTVTPVVSNLRIHPALVEWVFTLRPLLPSSIPSSSYLLDSQYMHIFALTLIYQ